MNGMPQYRSILPNVWQRHERFFDIRELHKSILEPHTECLQGCSVLSLAKSCVVDRQIIRCLRYFSKSPQFLTIRPSLAMYTYDRCH